MKQNQSKRSRGADANPVERATLLLDHSVRRHPDRCEFLFTSEEASIFLGCKTERSLEHIRKEYGLIGHRVGQSYLYSRETLEACARRMLGLPPRPPRA